MFVDWTLHHGGFDLHSSVPIVVASFVVNVLEEASKMSKNVVVIAVIAISGFSAAGQTVQPINDLPNPYTTVAD